MSHTYSASTPFVSVFLSIIMAFSNEEPSASLEFFVEELLVVLPAVPLVFLLEEHEEKIKTIARGKMKYLMILFFYNKIMDVNEIKLHKSVAVRLV
ncbi:MAG: hypothetical protein WDM90_20765 [Ferruginibacter sp.]